MNIYILELFIYICLIAIFCRLANVRVVFSSLSMIKSVFIIGFVYLLVVAQVFKTPQVTYPFAYWGMYSESHPTPLYMEHIITLDDGKIMHYPFEIIMFTSQRAFMRKIENLERSTRGNEEREVLEQALRSLIDIYEKKYVSHHIREFAINEVHISLNDTTGSLSRARINRFNHIRNP